MKAFSEFLLINVWSRRILGVVEQATNQRLSRNVQLAPFCHLLLRICSKLDSHNMSRHIEHEWLAQCPNSYLTGASNSYYPSDNFYYLVLWSKTGFRSDSWPGSLMLCVNLSTRLSVRNCYYILFPKSLSPRTTYVVFGLSLGLESPSSLTSIGLEVLSLPRVTSLLWRE